MSGKPLAEPSRLRLNVYVAFRLYLMTDHFSSSVWTDEPEHGMVPLDALPLDDETKQALEAWSPRGEYELSTEDQRDEGLRLWHAVREQLGPDYEVGLATFEPTGPYDADKVVIWHPDDLKLDVHVG